MRRWANIAQLAALAGVILSGCAADVPGYQRDVAPIFEATCAGCHVGDEPLGGIAFIEAPIDSLVSVPSEQADMDLVAPGDSLQSYLWHKIASTQKIAGGSGSTMPLGMSLSDDEIDLIADWIDGGAEP